MELVECTSSEAWDGFHATQPWSQFTQSWAWGEFRSGFVKHVKRFALVEEGEWLVAAQLEFRSKPIVGGFWFAPRGPVFASSVNEDQRGTLFQTFLEQLQRTNIEHPLFYRLEPPVPVLTFPASCSRSKPANPASTILVDLTSAEDKLLSALHPKTRYNTSLGKRHGITTRVGASENDVEVFLQIMKETAARDRFMQHDETYLRSIIDALHRSNMGRLRFAEREGVVLAANLEVVYGDTATYFHGGSTTAERQLKAPFVLQWDAMLTAKREGYHMYDLWGVNPEDVAAFYYKSSWDGITRFKRGWGGRQVDLVGTWDLPMNRFLYRAVQLQQKFRG